MQHNAQGEKCRSLLLRTAPNTGQVTFSRRHPRLLEELADDGSGSLVLLMAVHLVMLSLPLLGVSFQGPR